MNGFWLNKTIEDWQSKIPGIIHSFEEQISNINKIRNNATSGRVGNKGGIQNAVPLLNSRLNEVTDKKDKWDITIRNRVISLQRTGYQTDKAVAQMVSDSQTAFFNTYSWLRPEVQTSSFWDGWNRFWGGVEDCISNAWNSIVDWYNDHPIVSRIIIGVIAVAFGALVTVLTGGVAIPFLIGAGVMLAASSTLGAVIGGLTGGLEGMIQGAADGFMFGGIAALSGAIISITSLSGAAATMANGALAGGIGGAVSGGLSTNTFEGLIKGLIIGAGTGLVLSAISVGVINFIKANLVKINNPNPNMPYRKGRPSLPKNFKSNLAANGKYAKGTDPTSSKLDAGHIFGHEYKWLKSDYMNGYISKEQLVATYKNPAHYHLESHISNISHAAESSKPILHLLFPSITNGINTLKFPVVTSIVNNNIGFHISKFVFKY